MSAPTDDRYSAPPAADSGAYGSEQIDAYPPPPSEANRGRGFTIASVVCAVVGVVFLPIVFGVLGIVFGFVGQSKGDPKGKWAGFFAIACTIAGFAIGYAVLKHRL
jgi:MFS family permease